MTAMTAMAGSASDVSETSDTSLDDDYQPAFAVGLTGGIGSGKSTVAALFAARGASIIDTDQLAHGLTAPGGAAMPAIVQAFGPGFADASGALDRARMRQLVFADPAAKARLEALLHPLIRAAAQAAARAASGSYLMFDVPLLVEAPTWRQRVTRVLVVDCSPARQLARVVARNGMAPDQVRAIMAAQASRDQRRAVAHDLIDNNGAYAALAPQIDRLHALYLAISKRTARNASQRL